MESQERMSDNDIIKALEMCADDYSPCGDCPWYEVEYCLAESKMVALDLINRQKKEIERLKLTYSLKIGEVQEHYRNQIGRARAEAIKEFAEMLKGRKYTDEYFREFVLTEDIDNLVKEMTEGEA